MMQQAQAYRVFDITLTSNCPLPELPTAEGLATDLRLEVLHAATLPVACDWFHRWPSEQNPGEVHCMVAREPRGYRLRYPRLADFLIDSCLRHVKGIPVSGVRQDSIRHLFLDSVVPRLLGQRGRLIVHASAVLSPAGRGLAFAGGSGWGKSTLASALHQRGYRLISDDCLDLSVAGGRVHGLPAYAGARLLEDSMKRLFPAGSRSAPVAHYSSKQRVEIPGTGTAGVVEIDRLYLLGDPRGPGKPDSPVKVTIDEVKGVEATVALIRRAFLLDVEEKAAAKRQFEMANAIIAAGLRMYLLSYPREFSLLENVITSVEAHQP